MNTIVNEPFSPGSAVVLAELSPELRSNMLKVLAESSEITIVEAPPQPGARYKENLMHRVANVRMLAPGLNLDEKKEEKKPATSLKKNWCMVPSLETANNYCQQLFISGIHCSKYPRYCYMIMRLGSERSARVRPSEWLLKLVEEIFDSPLIIGSLDNDKFCFPARILQLLARKLDHHPKLLQQCTWDFLRALDTQRRSEPIIEILACFVQEFFDIEDLDFFLYLRNTVSQSSQSLLTRTQAKRYADKVSPHLYDAVLRPIFAKTDTTKDNITSISVAAFFLHLLQAFHNTKSTPDRTVQPPNQVYECEDGPPSPPKDKEPTSPQESRAAKAAYISRHFEDVLGQVPDEIAADIVDQVVDQMPEDLDPATITHEELAADIKPLVELLATGSL